MDCVIITLKVSLRCIRVSDDVHSWLTYSVPFGAVREPFRFEFRVTRGIGDDGHFALDNILLDNCRQSK